MKSHSTPNAISLQELPDGAEPCNLPAGTQLDLFGQPVYPVSHSLEQEATGEHLMTEISGKISTGSSGSVDLQLSLESKLRTLLDLDGSIEFSMTWKKRRTPVGRRYCQLAVLMLPTSEIDCGGWPTPQAFDATNHGKPRAMRLKKDGSRDPMKPGSWRGDLKDMAGLAAYPTPRASDAQNVNNSEATIAKRIREGRATIAELAIWLTPCATDGEGGAKKFMPGKTSKLKLRDYATWATPTSQDSKHLASNTENKRNANALHGMATMTTPSGLTSQTEKRGALNPDLSRWLMGYPEGWDCLEPTETP